MALTTRELTYLHELTPLRMRAVRKFKRDTQQLVAALLGIHRPSMTLIETGRQHLTVAQLLLFVNHYGVDVRWLLGLDLIYPEGTIPGHPSWDQYAWCSRDEYEQGKMIEAEYRKCRKEPVKKGGSK